MSDKAVYNLWPQTDESAPTYEELRDIECERRGILKKVELPFWRVLSSWSGTCLKALATDWLIWTSFAIFCAIRVQARLGGEMPGMAERLGITDIDILGGFLSFLLVLFVNQVNSRFFEMYQLSKKCTSQIQDVAGLASSQLQKDDAERLVRYMNAAHIAGYVGLGQVYKKQNYFDVVNNREYLLDANEMAALQHSDMDAGPATFKELCTWCQREIARVQKAGRIDSNESAQLHSHILEFRKSMDGIYNYCDQPTHFFYIHFLCVLSALYLPIFAVENGYSCGWGEESDWSIEVLSGVIVLLQSIFVVGLRLLGQKMIDPYGDDLEDLSVMTYISSTIENSRIILMAGEPDKDSDTMLAPKKLPSKEKNGEDLEIV